MTRDQRCQGQGESRYINTHQNQQYMFFCFEYGLAPFPGYTDHKEPWSDWPYCGSVSCWSSMGQPLGYVFIHTIQISIKHKHACTEWSRSSFKGTKMGLENEWKWRGLIYALAMLGHPILLHLDNELQLFAQKEGNFLGQSFHPSSATETYSKKATALALHLCSKHWRENSISTSARASWDKDAFGDRRSAWLNLKQVVQYVNCLQTEGHVIPWPLQFIQIESFVVLPLSHCATSSTGTLLFSNTTLSNYWK